MGDYQASGVLIAAYGQKADAPVPNMLAYLKQHVERGHASAQFGLAYAHDKGYWGLQRNPEKAFELYKLAAEGGNAHALCCVGICYARGLGVQQDDEQAVQWYMKAARAGSAQAQHNVGYSYEIGRRPLPRSMQEANRWYRRAALRDFDVAQYSLGLSYLHGKELPRSVELANRWFARAAQLGNPSAQVALGYSYETGRGVEVSYSRALELYKAAAGSEDAQGQHNYATMLENGRGRAEETAHQRELAEARVALTALGSRLAEQDPEYEKKRGLLVPILKPILRDYPPARWVQVFENAYANLILPTAGQGTESPRGETLPPESSASSIPEGEPQFGSDEAARLYWLTETPARAFVYLREVSEKISSLFGKTESAAKRDSLLHMFIVTMRIIDGMVAKNNPGILEEFRNANRQMLKSFWVQESVVGEHFDGKTCVALVRREIARHRMATDGTPIIPGSEPISSISERELDTLNAEVDRQRREAAAGRIDGRGTQTILLYQAPGFPGQVAISKVDPPVDGGAFFLDFSRPIQVIKSFLGRRNRQFGTAIELHVPIVHQRQNSKDTSDLFVIGIHSGDPRFSQVRALWKERYLSAANSPSSAVPGVKVIADLYAQFPDGC